MIVLLLPGFPPNNLDNPINISLDIEAQPNLTLSSKNSPV